MESEGQPLGWGSAGASPFVVSRRWALARFVRLRGLRFVVVLVVASAFLAGLPWARSKAVVGEAATSTAAQVRVFQNGVFRGSGTLVDRNWVLTAAHLFDRPDNPRIYSLRFGAVNNRNDQNDPTHLRSIDRIVLAPRGDMAMVHFVDPVPGETWIPSLATQAPRVYDWAHLYGWGPVGTAMNWASVLVYDPVAYANAAVLRPADPVFADLVAEGIGPIVLNVVPGNGDSGGGVFAPRGVLAGVFSLDADYRHANGSGNLIPPYYRAGYAQPVWQYRQWILDVINGAGTSMPDPDHDELRRRRLDDGPDGELPMSAPPQPDVCDEGASTCGIPDPVWLAATLTAASAGGGLVAATCASGGGNSCSFNGGVYVPGTPGQVKVGSGRQVMVWCKTTDALAVGGAPQRVLRVSFTNADPDQGPVGLGWWDVDPGRVAAADGPVDTARFATC